MKSKYTPRLGAGCAGGFLIALLFSGCAEFLAAGEQHGQGWREAHIVQIAEAASIERASSRDCRSTAANETAAKGLFAVYQYKGVSTSRRYLIAPLPDDTSLKVGDPVLVNIENCSLTPKLNQRTSKG